MKKLILLVGLLAAGFIVENAFNKHQMNHSQEIHLTKNSIDSSIEKMQ